MGIRSLDGTALNADKLDNLDSTDYMQKVADAATATPLPNGTATVGTSNKYARQDHVHPSDPSSIMYAYKNFGGAL